MNRDKLLEARIKARNTVNGLANDHLPAIFAALQPFVGKKVVLASGQLSQAVKSALPTIDSFFHPIFEASQYCLLVRFKVSENIQGGYSCVYAETVITLGKLSENVLTELYPYQALRTDYTAEEIKEYRRQLDVAEQRVNEINQKLYYFGKYDN